MSKAKEIIDRLDEAEPYYYSGTLTLESLASAILGEDSACVSNLDKPKRIKDSLKEAFDEIEARAMPEGVDWPRFEDGEPVRIGDRIFSPESGEVREVDCINFFKESWFFGFVGASSEMLERGKRVKRPQPVLASDGEPLEVGQTVWDDRGIEMVVTRSELDDIGHVQTSCEKPPSTVSISPSRLTHQRTVLDAEGIPIKVGDEVYLWDKYRDCADSSSLRKSSLYGIHKDTCLHVKEVRDDRITFSEHIAFCPPGWVTHEKPEECISIGDFVYLNDGYRTYAGKAEYESRGSNYSLCDVSAYERLLVDNVIDGVAVFAGKESWCPVAFLTKDQPFEVCRGSIVVLDEEHERYADSEWSGSEKPSYSLNGIEAGEPVMVDEVDGGTAYLDKYASWCPVSWLKKYENDLDSWEQVMEDIERWGGEGAKKFVLRCHEIARRENIE